VKNRYLCRLTREADTHLRMINAHTPIPIGAEIINLLGNPD